MADAVIDFQFNTEKAIQATAHLLRRGGGAVKKYPLIKMLYLADRSALKRWHEPITGDRPVSMQHGPALSTLYDLTKGAAPQYHARWAQFISDADPETHEVKLLNDPGTDDLCRAEMAILDSAFEKLNGMTFTQIKAWSHTLQEYDQSVGPSSAPIRFERIFRALNMTDEEVREIAARHGQLRIADALLSP